MLGQDEYPELFSHASSQTRQMSGALTPSSDSSLRLNDGISGKKRKRDGSTLEDLLEDNFVVKVSKFAIFMNTTTAS